MARSETATKAGKSGPKPRGMTAGSPTKEPQDVDRHVGSRVRMQRILVSMSQEKLGEACGITFQQFQKYGARAVFTRSPAFFRSRSSSSTKEHLRGRTPVVAR